MRKRRGGDAPVSAAEHFAAVVIGSGFGGSVAAYRLAEAGKNVCLLERGKRYPPGSFARTPVELRNNFWRPRAHTYGLFDVWSFGHIEAVVSAGLGGGSLIYANVLIRKDENWFVRDGKRGDGYEDWPVTRADLDPHYDAVEKILKPEIYPQEYQLGNKTAAMRGVAHELGIKETTYDNIDPRIAQFYLPQLAVTFRNRDGKPVLGEPILEGPNLHGKLRETCRLCGECDVGCNYGSKNTLDYNYLTLAERHGAQLRHLAEAEYIEPIRRDGRLAYLVAYTLHDADDQTSTELAVTADRVIVSCGTLGSTLLLLRSKERLPGLSRTLGHHFSGNGDILAFAVDCKERDAKGHPRPRTLNASRAPVITSTFRFPDARDNGGVGERGGYLQDAGYPLVGDYLWELTHPFAVFGRIFRFMVLRTLAWTFGSSRSEIGAELAALFGPAALSRSSMPLLGVGRDIPDGVMTLNRQRRLVCSWRSTVSKPWFNRIDRISRDVTRTLGGRYGPDPLTSIFSRQITVHPLGGCAMGRDRNHGVVDSYGRVYGWPGLYVADGAVMPGPVGPNPGFTIAALADRFAEQMLADWK